MAAARKVSPAASSTRAPRVLKRLASLAMVVVLPVPLTPTTRMTAGASGWLARPGHRVTGREQPDELGLERQLRRQVPALACSFDDLDGEVRPKVGRDEHLLDPLPCLVAAAAAEHGPDAPDESRAASLEPGHSSWASDPWFIVPLSSDGPGEHVPGPVIVDGWQVGEPERDHVAHRVVTSGHAVQRVRGLDGAPIVGDDHELDVLREAAQGGREPAHVRLVERGIHLVQDAEGHGPHLEHGEQQGHRGERTLATREHRQRLAFLARRTRRDLDTGRSEVLRRGQRQGCVPSTEQLLEAARERALERHERRPELVGDEPLEARDERPRVTDRVLEVGLL